MCLLNYDQNMASENAQDWDLISSYAGLLTLATFSIYAGAHGSLKVGTRHHKSLRHFSDRVLSLQSLKKVSEDKDAEEDEEDEEDDDIPDRLSAADAYLFPIVCVISST